MIKFRTIIRKITTAFKNPKLFLIVPLTKLSFLFSDELYLKTNFRLKMGKKLDLKNPQTFNEKLQWLKLFYRNPQLTMLVDKYECKKYVANLIGEDHIIPTLGLWDSFRDINFNLLPDQFVLKTTHDQGGVVICKNREDFDFEFARKKLNKHLRNNHFYLSREWPYKNVKPRIIAEKFLVDEKSKELTDYKFFCFNGEPKALFVATERQTGNVKFDYFDIDFNRLNLVQYHEPSKKEILKPKGFDEMLKFVAILAGDHPHVRVDFYNIDGAIYFGELTFFHHGGHTPFHPEEWDFVFGKWIDLPKYSR